MLFRSPPTLTKSPPPTRLIKQADMRDLEELDPEDAEDDEEGAADEDNVPDGLEGGEEGLHHQLQPGGSVDHPAQQLVQSAAIHCKC